MREPSAPIPLVAFRDPWPLARERWWDIGSHRRGGRDASNQFNAWLRPAVPSTPVQPFDYATRAANVRLTYDQKPRGKYFVGHISARRLKPNFAYQLKLAGKPVGGPRGMGRSGSFVSVASRDWRGAPVPITVLGPDGQPLPINGDDWTSQQLGYVGRWWNDSNASGNTNAVTDRVYRSNILDTIYGYQFLGVFVTDRNGDAEWDITGRRSYHATWQDWQKGPKDVHAGDFYLRGAFEMPQVLGARPTFYGYGALPPGAGDERRGQNGRQVTRLFYELESRRPNPVTLARGLYRCRLLITEESFHNGNGATRSLLGGRWKTVLATEDFQAGRPDTDPANDIVFTIG